METSRRKALGRGLEELFNNWVIPSSAKNSHCTGIITESDAINAFVVKIPSDGGQSIII